ncbi:MAG TPA: hypothetical protein VJ914_34500 [Pseudonocardiaceae bacterium]|nr:hypothetical protein [Pseudonocardiaceae bacterium]
MTGERRATEVVDAPLVRFGRIDRSPRTEPIPGAIGRIGANLAAVGAELRLKWN